MSKFESEDMFSFFDDKTSDSKKENSTDTAILSNEETTQTINQEADLSEILNLTPKKPQHKPSRPKTSPSKTKAEKMATKQREISISEFFAKNKQLLGFDSPKKALLTTIKEEIIEMIIMAKLIIE